MDNHVQTEPLSIYSPPTGKIALALAKAQGAFKQPTLNRSAEIKKEGKLLYTTQYADLNECIESVREALSKNELAFTQTIQTRDNRMLLILTLWHSSGESLESIMPLSINNLTSQQIGSQMTYLKRYQFSAFFGLAADFDDDGNAEIGQTYGATDKKGKGNNSTPPKTGQNQPKGSNTGQATTQQESKGPSPQELLKTKLEEFYAIVEDNMIDNETAKNLIKEAIAIPKASTQMTFKELEAVIALIKDKANKGEFWNG